MIFGSFPCGPLNTVCLRVMSAYIYDQRPSAPYCIFSSIQIASRSATTASVVNGIIYVIAGQDAGLATSSVESYDVASNSWSKAARATFSRFGVTSAVVDGKIYVLGGALDPRPPHPGLTWVEMYVPPMTTGYFTPQQSTSSNLVIRNQRPNPFQDQTQIEFTNTIPGRVKAQVATLAGEPIALLYDDFLLNGVHTLPWSGQDDGGNHLPTGIYVFTVQLQSHQSPDITHKQSSKLLLVR